MENYKVIIFDKLPEELEKQAEKLRYICFNKGSLSEEERKDLDDRFCSKHDRFKYILALVTNKPIANIILYKRTITFNGKQVRLGGIGGVCTQGEYQRKGIATRLLKKAMEALKQAGCDIAYLCTDVPRLGKLYEQVGFKQLPEQYTFVGESGKRYYEWGGMIAPLNSLGIFHEVIDSNENFDIGKGNW